MIFRTMIDGKKLDFDFTDSSQSFTILDDGSELTYDIIGLGENAFSLLLNGKSYYLTIIKVPDGIEVTVDHQTQFVEVFDETQILFEKLGMNSTQADKVGEIHALIPGMVSKIFVTKGDTVSIGEKLLILEAMKMENEINSPIVGTVKEIFIAPGSTLDKGEIIMEITP